jgi:hypothetical protein
MLLQAVGVGASVALFGCSSSAGSTSSDAGTDARTVPDAAGSRIEEGGVHGLSLPDAGDDALHGKVVEDAGVLGAFVDAGISADDAGVQGTIVNDAGQ